MKPQRNRLIIGICLAILVLLAFCDTAAAKPPVRGFVIRSGPPAHAPAYGYRRKQIAGFELVFDVGLGVYVAVGVTDVYYRDGWFYRCRAGVWEISLQGATWEVAGIDRLPPGLQIKAKSMIKLNGNGNSLVKLSGNDNGPNGNAGGPDPKSNSPAVGGVNKPAEAAGGNLNRSVGPGSNAGSTPAGGAAKANASADAGVGKATGNAGAAATKPTGSQNNALGKTNASPNTTAAKPSGSSSRKPAGNGKKK